MLRHTKSNWDEPGLSDHDRPLNERGQNAAAQLAEYFAELKLSPDRIICSTALRTRQTLAPILEKLSYPSHLVEFNASIYEAPAASYLDAICTVEPGKTILIVGHNPTIEELALSLLAQDHVKLLKHIKSGYPTGGLTRIVFDEKNWEDALKTGGRLLSFVSPRSLPI